MKRNRPEDVIQSAVCQHLRRRGAAGMVWFAVPNGGKRRPVEAAIMKGLGVTAGVADIILLRKGRAYALELKTDKGRPTEAQMTFMSDWNEAGGFGCIVHGLDKALRSLEVWGLLEGRTV